MGLETAILLRKRNSSLIYLVFLHRKLAGLSNTPMSRIVFLTMVAERSIDRRSLSLRKDGDIRSEDADMSNTKKCEKHFRRKSKVSCSTKFGAGLVGT